MAKDCLSPSPEECGVTITAVLLESADLPLLVELEGVSDWSGRLQVTHLDFTGAPGPPPPADAIRIVPPEAPPGSTVDLFFPEENERGVGYRMSELVDGDWVPRYALISDPEDYDGGGVSWGSYEEFGAWDLVSIGGPGPDPVEIPDVATPGRYRICTVAPVEEICGEMTVTDGQAEPPQLDGDLVDMIGLWEILDAAGEEPGAILRLDVHDLRLLRDCGVIYGAWDADHAGGFLADSGGWSGECGEAPWPGWLDEATMHRPDGDGHVLRDAGGAILARLVPGEEPTLPPTVAQSQAQRPVVTDETRAALAPAAPLPDDLTPADAATLRGRWIPSDAPPVSQAHVHFDAEDRWRASDGCNGTGGRWGARPDGGLLAAGGGDSFGAGCENIPVGMRVERAARAGLDEDTLVLLDRQGAELGRFHRDVCQPTATAPAPRVTGTFDSAEDAARAVEDLPAGGTLEQHDRKDWQAAFVWMVDGALTHRIYVHQVEEGRWGVGSYEQCAAPEAPG